MTAQPFTLLIMSDSKGVGIGSPETYDYAGFPQVSNRGTYRAALPTVTLTGATDGTGAQIAAAFTKDGNGAVNGIGLYVVSRGTGYKDPTKVPTLVFSGGDGTGGAGYFIQANGYTLDLEARLKAAGLLVTLKNGAISGQSSSNMGPLYEQGEMELLMAGDPTKAAILINVGVNDGSQNITKADYKANLLGAVNQWVGLGYPIIIDKTCGVSAASNLSNAAALNALVKSYGDAVSEIVSADTSGKVFLGADLFALMDPHPEYFGVPARTGSIHPNAAGHTAEAPVMAAAYAPILMQLFGAISQSAPDAPPVVTSAALSASGSTVLLSFSLPIQRAYAQDFFLSNAGGFSSHALSADGLTLTLTLRRPVYASETPTLTYAGVSLLGVNGIFLPSFTALAVTNNSTRRAFGPPAYLNVAYPGFTWPIVAGATGYRLYQNGILVYDTVNAAGANTATSFTDPAAADGRPIDQPTFTVSAYDGTGEGPQSGTADGTAAALFTQGTTSVTLTDGAVVNGQTVRLSGPQRVVVNDVRYDVPVGVPVLLPNSVRSVLQNANLIA